MRSMSEPFSEFNKHARGGQIKFKRLKTEMECFFSLYRVVGLIHKEKNVCSFLGCTTAREVQNAADDKEMAAGSPEVP